MRVRKWATFTSDLPDDLIDDGGEEIIQYGGKSVLEAIAEMLRRLGCTAGAPRYADEHGWDLDIYLGKRRFWCQVTLIEGYLMVLEDASSFFSKLLGRSQPAYLDVLTRLARELASDERFHDVAWFLDSEVFSPGVEGAKEPVGP